MCIIIYLIVFNFLRNDGALPGSFCCFFLINKSLLFTTQVLGGVTYISQAPALLESSICLFNLSLVSIKIFSFTQVT